MKSRPLKRLLIAGTALAVLFGTAGVVWVRHFRNVHQHCIKCTGMAFRTYALEHGGALPYHTNGFADAMLLLVKEKHLPGVAWICGPGDDGTMLSNALAHGLDVPEDRCTRVYVQGLTKTNDPTICIVFDLQSVPGGDHRYGWGPRVREVCMLDGSMETIPDEKWPEFCRKQIDLLVSAGFTRQKALEYYRTSANAK